ncbi:MULTISPECIES: hypothetical protein [unclassified Mycolicibacterium]|nr:MULTISPECIES: hypothetical protein [unclassified Mycolicibacterium]
MTPRDVAHGFHALLCVEFLRLTAPSMIGQHRWHLGCEFGTRIEAAVA